MAAETPKQRRQQALAWKLKVVMGAAGTLYPREQELPPEIHKSLMLVYEYLNVVAKDIRKQLKADHETNRKSSISNTPSSDIRPT